MAILFLSAGSDETFDMTLPWLSSGPTPTSDATTVHTGPRSIKCPSTSGNPCYIFPGVAIALAATGRTSVYLRWSALPTTGAWTIALQTPAGRFQVNLQTSGILQVTSGGTPLVTGSTGLSAGTWYRLALAWNIASPTAYTITLWINGTQYVTITNGTALDSNAGSLIAYGLLSDPGSTVDVFVDDVYVDDSGSLTDPGDIRVTAKLPTSTTTNNFTAPGGTGAVNERPLNTSNYAGHETATQVSQNYAIQGITTGDVSLAPTTIVGFGAWLWARGLAGGSGTPKITLNGSDTAIVLTNTGALYMAYVTSSSYPTNPATVGMVSTGTADGTYLFECGTLFAYVPTTGTTWWGGALAENRNRRIREG